MVSLVFLLVGNIVPMVNSFKEDLILRTNIDQCSDVTLFKKLDPKNPKTALASPPGYYLVISYFLTGIKCIFQ